MVIRFLPHKVFLKQLFYGLVIEDCFGDFGSKQVWRDAKLCGVEHGVEYGGHEVFGTIRFGGRTTARSVGTTYYLSHYQATARKQKWSQGAVMIRSSVPILFDRRASHFTRYNQEDLVAKAARLDVVEKCGHGVSHLGS